MVREEDLVVMTVNQEFLLRALQYILHFWRGIKSTRLVETGPAEGTLAPGDVTRVTTSIANLPQELGSTISACLTDPLQSGTHSPGFQGIAMIDIL